MYTQFFGNYLLSTGMINKDQLIRALVSKSESTLKLGTLAINAGYMTASEVEKVHSKQTGMDKMFGELAVELGYINIKQLTLLLSSQKSGYLLLGQSLVDNGDMTNAQLEEALKLFKDKYSVENSSKVYNEMMFSSIVEKFVAGSDNRTDFHLRYIMLLIKNLIRFVGDDFILLNHNDPFPTDTLMIEQNIVGEHAFKTRFFAEKDVLVQFVSRFINEDLWSFDDYVEAGACDFLNLHNGLYAVNMSIEQCVELNLTAPEVTSDSLSNSDPSLVLKALFPFGMIAFDLTPEGLL